MSDITANVVVSMPTQPFTMARFFKAVANGRIYIGKIDTDPTIPDNQIQVYLENEDGSYVPVPQPIRINAGGFPVYNGQIAKFVTVQGHSMAVLDAFYVQQFYFPNVLKYDPDQLRKEMSSDRYQFVGGQTNIDYGNSTPTKLLYGPGKITINSVSFSGLMPGVDVPNSSIYFNPTSYYDDLGESENGDSKLNLIMNVGAKIDGTINRSTFVGSQGPKQILNVDRCDAFGNGAMMYTKYCERSVAIGTISCQWLGTNNPAADNHQWWSNAGGFIPGQSGWNYDGMEVDNPGIGAKIAAFNGFAKQPSDCGRSVGIGRNAFNGSVLLNNCTAVGYRAGAGMFAASNMVALGTDSYRNGVFLTNSIAAGVFSGVKWQEGAGNALFGYNSGSGAVTGERNTLIGSFSGSDAKTLTDCVFIGYGAGNDVIADTPIPNNVLAIGNDVTGVGAPLISGNMSVPKLGVNILPSRIAATLHVRSSDAAASVAPPSGAADEFIIENGGNTGMTIRSAATSLGVINFSSPTLPSAGAVSYNHSTSEMTLRAANSDKWKINSSSLSPVSDNAYSIGTSALRASVIYAASGAINTSDGRVKTDEVDLSDKERQVALKLKSLIRRYRFKDAVEKKGTEARLHFGVIAQDVKAAFEEEGLIAESYGILCYDEWEDQYTPIYQTRVASRKILKSQVVDSVTGEISSEEYETVEYEEEYDTGDKRLVIASGNRYGIRYDELLCFIIAAM